MQSMNIRFVSACVLLMLITQASVVQAATFSDTSFSWYESIIEQLAEQGVITGHPDGTFKPRASINRAEFLTLVMRGRYTPQAITEPCFPDITLDAWYTEWVCEAKKRGIVQGYPDGTFKAEQIVNMVEAQKMIFETFGIQAKRQTHQEWFEPYSEYLHVNELVSKYSYLPGQALRRERAADLFYKVREFSLNKTTFRLSAGCNQQMPSSPPTSVVVNGQARNYLVHIPPQASARTSLPLLFAFHGRTNSNQQVRDYYKFDQEANDVYVIYPSALPENSSPRSYRDPGDSSYEIRDIQLFDAIVRTMADQYCIDMFRIFAGGHSLGGWMSNSLGCVRGDVVRGAASVGSSGVVADCAGPTGSMLIHNPLDDLAPISSGERVRELRLQQNQCANTWQSTEPLVFKCNQAVCSKGQPLLWCPHTINTSFNGSYYPHTWPRGTGEIMLDFFKNLPY